MILFQLFEHTPISPLKRGLVGDWKEQSELPLQRRGLRDESLRLTGFNGEQNFSNQLNKRN